MKESLESTLTLITGHMRGVQAQDRLEWLLAASPFYREPRVLVQEAISAFVARGWLREHSGGLEAHVPEEAMRLLFPNSIAALVELTPDELRVLEIVFAHGGQAPLEDLDAIGFDDDPQMEAVYLESAFRLIDATKLLEGKRLLTVTLDGDGEPLFVVPAHHHEMLRKAHEELLPGVTARRRHAFMKALRDTGVLRCPRVEAAFDSVRFEELVPEHLRAFAYSHASLEIERPFGQWRARDGFFWGRLEEPKRAEDVVADARAETGDPVATAEMLTLAELQPGQRVLVCSVGNGALLALVSFIVGEEGEVVGVDARIDSVQRNMRKLGVSNVRLQQGDPSMGCPEGRFDRILVDANVPRIPRPLLDQLKDDAILLLPIEHGQDRPLLVLRTTKGIPTFRFEPGFSFSPLRGQQGWGDVELLSHLDALRTSTSVLLRARIDINHCWQTLRGDTDFFGESIELELDIARLLEPAETDDQLRIFAQALQRLTTDRCEHAFIAANDRESGKPKNAAAVRATFENNGMTLPLGLENEALDVSVRLARLHRIRNLLSHALSASDQRRLKESLQPLLGKPLPATRVDHRRLQVVLLSDIAGALSRFGQLLREIINHREGLPRG